MQWVFNITVFQITVIEQIIYWLISDACLLRRHGYKSKGRFVLSVIWLNIAL